MGIFNTRSVHRGVFKVVTRITFAWYHATDTNGATNTGILGNVILVLAAVDLVGGVVSEPVDLVPIDVADIPQTAGGSAGHSIHVPNVPPILVIDMEHFILMRLLAHDAIAFGQSKGTPASGDGAWCRGGGACAVVWVFGTGVGVLAEVGAMGCFEGG